MKLEYVPETDVDREEMRTDAVPFTLWVQSMLAAQVGRVLQDSVRLGVFEALAKGPLTADEVAARCKLALPAVRPLMNALATTAYVRFEGDRYALTERGQRSMVGLDRGGFADWVRAGALEIAVQAELGDFLQTDAPVRAAKAPSKAQWLEFERGQLAYAKAREAAVLAGVPVPAGAKALLDIGAAHGRRAAAFCAKHPGLSATVLDFPEAVEASTGLLAEEAKALGVVGRVSHRAADPRTADFGEASLDLILVSSSLVRLNAKQTTELIQRCARALRPGGLLAIDDFVRPSPGSQAGQQALLEVLQLSMRGEDGPSTAEELAGWQRAAGLSPLPPVATAGQMSTLQMARKEGTR